MRVCAAIVVGSVVTLTLSLSAHHSHGQYDETFQDIEGVVKELHLLTPHSWLYIEVKDKAGATQLWALEATTRAQLEGIGVTRDTLKPGDVVVQQATNHAWINRGNDYARVVFVLVDADEP